MSRQDALHKAKSQYGTVESPFESKKTPEVLWYAPKLNEQNWFSSLPIGTPLLPRKGRLITNPEPGTIVIYDWQGTISNQSNCFSFAFAQTHLFLAALLFWKIYP